MTAIPRPLPTGLCRIIPLLSILAVALLLVAPAEAGSFTPNDINDLYAWYTVDTLAGHDDGDAVTSWVNSQGDQGFDLSAMSLTDTDYAAPTYSATGLDGGPAVRFQVGTADVAFTPMSTTDSFGLVGNPAFTVIFVGQIASGPTTKHPLTWGNGQGRYAASTLEIDGNGVDWATGWGHDAKTAGDSFVDHFDSNVTLTVTHRAGESIFAGTNIFVDGEEKPIVSGDTGMPNIVNTPLYLGPAPDIYSAWSPDMLVREVIIYDRALSGAELASLQPYLNRSPVPIPSTILLLGSGLAGLAGIARRKRE